MTQRDHESAMPLADTAQAAAEQAGDVHVGVRHGERDAPVVSGGGVSAFLYDADGDDLDIAPDKGLLDDLADEDLLWVDVDSSQAGAVEQVTALLPVHLESMSVAAAHKAFIHDFGESFVIGVLPVPARAARPESEMLICAVGNNWLVTVHDGDVGTLEGFADHLRGDSFLGRLDAPSLLARLLEWVINGYFDYLDGVHDTIDGIEDSILRHRTADDVIGRLVELRHDTGRLRRRLSPHRQVVARLSHPSFDVTSGRSAARVRHPRRAP